MMHVVSISVRRVDPPAIFDEPRVRRALHRALS